MAEPLIGLEISYRKIKLVETVTLTTAIEVTNFACMDLPPGGFIEAVDRLRSLLRENNFKGKKVNVLLSYPSIDCIQVTLPPMSKTDLKLAALREAKKDTRIPLEELAIAYEKLGESEEKGLRKMEVLIARANSNDIKECFRVLKEAGLHPKLLCVLPTVLLNLLRMREDLKEETVAGVFLGDEKGTIVILHKRQLLFPREFPLKLTAGVGGIQNHLLAELKRTLLYLKQKARGLEPQRILLLGHIEKSLEIADLLTQELGIKTEIYFPPELDLSPLEDRIKEFKDSIHQFILPIGLAWNRPERSELNLFAKEISNQRKTRIAKWAVITTAILFALLSTIRLTWILNEGRPYWQDLKRAQDELATLRPKVAKIATVLEERDKQKLTNTFLRKLEGPQTEWEKLLRTLSLIVPEEMHLELLDLKETPKDCMLRLKGQTLSPDVSLIHNRFKEFFSIFLTSPGLTEERVETFKIGPALKKEGNPSFSRLEFTVAVKVK